MIFLLNLFNRGHDFRTSFRKIGGLRVITIDPFIALTATASAHIEEDIVSSLFLKDPVQVSHILTSILVSQSKGLSVSREDNFLCLQF